MAEKFIPCINPCDNLALLAEIIKTLRAAFGMPAAVYDASKGGLIIPDDYSMPEEKPAFDEEKFVEAIVKGFNEMAAAEAKAVDEPPAEEPKAEAPKKEAKPKGK